MLPKRLSVPWVAAFLLWCAASVTAQPAASDGRLEGHVVNQGGTALGGVLVRIEELGRSELTDAAGKFSFGGLPPGTYSVLATLGPQSQRHSGVVISPRETTTVRTVVDWAPSVFESVLVSGTTRLPSRLVEAPAAATVLGSEELATHAPHGQLPRVLAGTPGVEIVQSGLYNFNLNSRGFNNFYNRYILTRIDGRDPSLPTFLGYVDWAALSLPLDDIEQLEFVRGPSAALYGAGAVNGVLNIRTRAPRESLGGRVRYTLGELGTQRIEFHHAASLGRGWFLKATGGHHRSGDFTQSRVTAAEYAAETLPRDIIAPTLDRVRLSYGSVRIDKHAAPDRLLSFEAGTAQEEGPVTVSPAARTQAVDVDQPWFRVNLASPRWNVVGYYSANHMNGSRNLTAGSRIYVHGTQAAVEAQTNRQFAGARGRVVAGAEFGGQTANTTGPDGTQTAFDRRRSTRYGSVFGQVEYQLAARLNSVVSARWDAGTLHEGRVSPRVAAVYTLAPAHTIRVTYGRAFQPANLTNYFLSIPIAPPIDLSQVEAALTPAIGNTPLGFTNVPVIAVGNDQLRVERIDSAELGYQGVIGGRLLVNASLYANRLKDFVTFLLPQVGTSLGRLNESFGPYVPPASLSSENAALVTSALHSALPPSLFEAMSNDADGRPVIALLSFSNFGTARTMGVELGATAQLPAGWRIQGSYTGFRSNVSDIPENPLLPNTPGHQFGAATAYSNGKIDGGLRYRWVDAFQWRGGLFVGPVPSYGVLDLNGSYDVTDQIAVGVDVANLLDNEHYEAFGGDLLSRRTLGHVTYSW